MAQLTVNNNVFNYPDPGSDPGWGEGASGWAKAVTDVLNVLLAPGDIIETTLSIANNQSSATNIIGLAFDGATVRAANVMYGVNRIIDAGEITENEVVEAGMLYISYNSHDATWTLTQMKQGDAGMAFSILANGQIQYTSTELSGVTYVGQIKFSARTLSQ